MAILEAVRPRHSHVGRRIRDLFTYFWTGIYNLYLVSNVFPRLRYELTAFLRPGFSRPAVVETMILTSGWG